MLNHRNEQPTRPKRVVVLGSNGFVGSHTVKKLTKEGIEVLGLSRKEINLLDASATENLLKVLKPEDTLVVVSAIAPCKNNAQLLDNLKMMKVVGDVLEKITLSHLVYISSDAVYANNAVMVTESTPAAPDSLHGLMHVARELMLKTCVGKTPLAILRPSLLYGLEDPHNGYGPNRSRRLIEDNKNIVLFGKGEEKRDHVFIEDVAGIVSLVVQHRSEGILNVATGESLSFREIAERLVEQAGNTVEIQDTPRQNPITHRYFDIAAQQKAFPHFHYKKFSAETLLVRQEEMV